MMVGQNDSTLVVIPTLNEAAHIGPVLDQIGRFARRETEAGRDSLVVVADGGSTDGTQTIVRTHPNTVAGLVVLIKNVSRIQSAGINLAVEMLGSDRTWLIRVDAHARYPNDFPDVLIAEAEASGAASVVVAMRAIGHTPIQRAIALAQNSRIGNGGSAHRTGNGGRFVTHGHHALMRLDAFRQVGGYDPAFSHNEDAELDIRLTSRGHKIWQTARTSIDYIPRASLSLLSRQYVRFGSGRAQTLCKHWHQHRPQVRQIVIIALAPLMSAAVLAPAFPILALPGALWIMTCLLAGLVVTGRHGGLLLGLHTGIAAGVMHLSWSAGFWWFLLRRRATGTPLKSEARP